MPELQNAEARQTNPAVASEFNALRVGAGSPLSENALSDIIAFLLRPDEEHAQSASFLSAFLETLNIPQHLISVGTVRVTREAFTTWVATCMRRMDIVIRSSTGALLIENKPFADDQVQQLDAYCEQMEHEYGENFALIYITPGRA